MFTYCEDFSTGELNLPEHWDEVLLCVKFDARIRADFCHTSSQSTHNSGVAMGLLDRLVGRHSTDLLEWIEPSTLDSLAIRHADLRLKDGTALIVHPGQVCVLGTRVVADVIGPGRYTLTPATLPKLTAARVVRGAGKPFRADVCFVSVVPHSPVLWATVASVTAKDDEGGTIRAKASGDFGFVVTDPVLLANDVGGTNLTRSEISTLVTSQFGEIFRTGVLDGADLLGPTGRLGLVAGEHLAPLLLARGITLIRFTVDKVIVPPEVRRPYRAVSAGGGSEGYRAEIPKPLFQPSPASAPNPVPASGPASGAFLPRSAVERGIPALPPGLAEILEPPSPRDNGPKSARIAIVEDAPEGVFASRHTAPPKSERLLLTEIRSVINEMTAAPGGTPESPLMPDPSYPHAPQSVTPPAPAPAPAATTRPPGPPPLPATLEFYVALNGESVGPFDLISLSARVRDGSLNRKTLVWRTGMECWLAAELVIELAPLFTGPPPIPSS